MALNGRVAVVTGAALGIGKAITEILLQNGAKVVVLDVNETAGKSLKEDLDKQYGQERTLFLNCDVESQEQIKAAFQKTAETFGGIDILCNNAGILNESEWEKTVSVNLVRIYRCPPETFNPDVDRYNPHLTGLAPVLCCPVYTAAKHGVIGFTRAMAAVSAASGYGIRFNAICPGLVQTDLLSTILDRLGQFSHLADEIKKYAVMGVLNMSEVAECLLELVTDETKNGEALIVKPNIKKYMTFPTLIE
uniref:Zgc:56585 n=1 Tax=Seriola dumerili TaxID=41447 RepID=A0A3B4T2Z0_SERDU